MCPAIAAFPARDLDVTDTHVYKFSVGYRVTPAAEWAVHSSPLGNPTSEFKSATRKAGN